MPFPSQTYHTGETVGNISDDYVARRRFFCILQNRMERGVFITFEGIDGSGKTTQATRLKNFLTERGVEVVMTREPGGTRVAEKIRDILLDRNNIGIVPRAELMLYLASRAQHTAEIIRPALERGMWVISDRFTDSSVAYQGCARGLGMEKTRELSLFATEGLHPDLTFYLEITPEEASRRLAAQGKALDRLEVERKEFYLKVIEGYRWIASQEPHRFIIIDGSAEPEKVWEQVRREFLKRYGDLVGE